MNTRTLWITLLAAVWICANRAPAQEPPPPGEPPLPSAQETIAFLESRLPETHADLQQLRQREPEAYAQEVRNLGHLVRHYRELENNAPELAAGMLRAHRLDRQCRQLAEKIRSAADEPEKGRLKTQLQTTLDEIFELRMAERELEVQHLERELNHIRTLLDTRRQAKTQIIDRRMRDLTLEVDEALGWW
jgi:hypothetical protein